MQLTQTDINGNVLGTTEIKLIRENETNKTLLDKICKVVNITHWWDSHGHLVNWDAERNGKREHISTYRNCNIKIVEKEWDETVGDSSKQHFNDWEVFINGNKLKGSCYKYSIVSNGVNLKLVNGWG